MKTRIMIIDYGMITWITDIDSGLMKDDQDLTIKW